MRAIALTVMAAALAGCEPAMPPGGGAAVQIAKNPQLEVDLKAVRSGRIFFSHHSVGENVLEGLRRVAAEGGATPPQIVALGGDAVPVGPVLLHASGGRNGDPASKIAYFEATIRGNAGLRADVALMKFCYVDFNPDTDVDALLARYQAALAALKRERPEIRFAHVTAPLIPSPAGLKASLRRKLGLQEWTDASNAKRDEYNRKLRQAFASDPIFDLAAVESTGPDGMPVSYEMGGKRFPSMAPAYTDDGGHLNALGQRKAGTAVIRFLAEALGGRPARN